MTIYECLGIDHLLLDIPIPKEMILNNTDQNKFREAEEVFRGIESICLRVSLNRSEGYLQVIEIVLNRPENIEKIACIIQKAIKYHILFVFIFEERYLILWRNFKLTESTEYVYSDRTTYCTDWIYEESLTSDILWTYNTIRIDGEGTTVAPLTYGKVSKTDDGKMADFSDVIRNVYALSGAIINRELICTRYLFDWMACHALGNRVSLNELLCSAIRDEIYCIIDDHLFFETDRLEVLCSEIECPNSKFRINIGRTGKIPMVYYDSIPIPSTHEDENRVIDMIYEIQESDGQYLVPVIGD